MKIVNMNEVNIAQTPHGVDVRKLMEFEHATIVHIKLKPGEAVKKHVTPVDVNFYIIEGEGEIEIGDEKELVRKDDLVFSPARIPHKLSNNSGKPFRFLVIKTPTPMEETKIL
ncbi:MAG: cupin domain-containing protein [Candidatus Lokiarchaeota archaeon]|nr:cupin domain-containing protein [Candidatus Lokiarchaeota archaeon]